jgi:hypothetical protein
MPLARGDLERATAIGDNASNATTQKSAEVTITVSASGEPSLFRGACSFEPDPPSALAGGCALADQLDSVGGQRIDQLHE